LAPQWAAKRGYAPVRKAESERWLILHVRPADATGFYEFFYRLRKTRAVLRFVFCSAAGEESSPPLPAPELDVLLQAMEEAIQCSS
jgi:hypothetical protein